MPNLLLSFIAFVAYVLLAGYFWHANATSNCDTKCRGALGHLSLIPITLHGYLLWQGIFADGGIELDIYNALSLIAWLTLLVYSLARFFYPIGGLQALVLPLAAVTLLLPGVFPAEHHLSHTNLWTFKVHIAVAMLAYSLFTIAALHAVLISLVERRLRHATLPRLLRSLPPLMTMESLLFRMIGTGFVLLTLTLISGIFFSEEIFGKAFEFNHKVVFGFVSWCVFAVLLYGQRCYGWRGKIAVRWTLGGFLFLVLGYLGSEFVLEVLLHR